MHASFLFLIDFHIELYPENFQSSNFHFVKLCNFVFDMLIGFFQAQSESTCNLALFQSQLLLDIESLKLKNLANEATKSLQLKHSKPFFLPSREKSILNPFNFSLSVRYLI